MSIFQSDVVDPSTSREAARSSNSDPLNPEPEPWLDVSVRHSSGELSKRGERQVEGMFPDAGRWLGSPSENAAPASL